MRVFIKLLSISFLFCSVIHVFSGVTCAAAQQKGDSLNFLVIGFDNSPANTDVICVVSFDCGANMVRVLQIPRDSYISYGDRKGKINGFYLDNINSGKTNDEALASLTAKVSDLLGIRIDGYVALTSDGFVDFIDYIGGVKLLLSDVPSQIRDSFGEENGIVSLDGKSALEFVRYRKNYNRGDLERLDAQKAFLKALFSDLKGRREFFSVFKFISKNDGITFDINKTRSASFALQNIGKISSADFQIMTLPGEAEKIGDTWYYIINKPKAKQIVKEYFPYSVREFDVKNNFITKLQL